MFEFTSRFWWTFESAKEKANILSKGGDIHGDPSLYADLKKQYVTFIKGAPHDPTYPNECWAITNKFDPRVHSCKNS
jgi:hypothetical protein